MRRRGVLRRRRGENRTNFLHLFYKRYTNMPTPHHVRRTIGQIHQKCKETSILIAWNNSNFFADNIPSKVK